MSVQKRALSNLAHQLRQDTVRLSGSSDPVVTAPVVSVTHKFTNRFTSSEDGLHVITIATLYAVFPGTSFAWFRLVKFSAFAASAPDSFIVLYPSTTSNSLNGGADTDHFEFEDFGVQGRSRPAIHISPNFRLRTQWNDITSTTNNEIFIIKTLPSSEIIIQYTLDLKTARPTSIP